MINFTDKKSQLSYLSKVPSSLADLERFHGENCPVQLSSIEAVKEALLFVSQRQNISGHSSYRYGTTN